MILLPRRKCLIIIVVGLFGFSLQVSWLQNKVHHDKLSIGEERKSRFNLTRSLWL